MRALRSFGFALAVLLGGACSSNNIVRISNHGGPDDPNATDDGGTMLDDSGMLVSADGAPIGPTGPTTAVQVIVEPNGNNASELVAAINAATKSVHMVMYLLTSTDVQA